MVTNAYNECKQIIGEMRGAAAYLKALPASSKAVQLEVAEKGEDDDGVD